MSLFVGQSFSTILAKTLGMLCKRPAYPFPSSSEKLYQHLKEHLSSSFGSSLGVCADDSKGRLYQLDELPGVAYLEEGQIIGMARGE